MEINWLEWLEALPNFFICLANYVVAAMRYMLGELFMLILLAFWVVTLPFDALLPDALDQPIPSLDHKMLGYINWIFPIGFLAQLFTYTITALGLYRVLKWVASKLRGPIQPRLF